MYPEEEYRTKTVKRWRWVPVKGDLPRDHCRDDDINESQGEYCSDMREYYFTSEKSANKALQLFCLGEYYFHAIKLEEYTVLEEVDDE